MANQILNKIDIGQKVDIESVKYGTKYIISQIHDLEVTILKEDR